MKRTKMRPYYRVTTPKLNFETYNKDLALEQFNWTKKFSSDVRFFVNGIKLTPYIDFN